MDLNVRVEGTLSGSIENAVSFETGLTRGQLQTTEVAYEHHGEEFSPEDRGALPAFFEDLLLGRPMPTTFATRSVQDIDTLMAIALFLHRDLATHPNTPSFVSLVDFVHRRGLPALAHIEEPLARFLSALRSHFPESSLSQRELSARLISAIGWIREYIHEGTLPVLGPAPSSSVRVLDQGTGGFAVAETSGCLWDGWVELYRLGFLRGVLISAAGDRKKVLIARKSHHVRFDLSTAARLLNQVEIVMAEAPEWTVSRDALWLEQPAGTLILLKDILAILLRV
jgi:hypothetical protein